MVVVNAIEIGTFWAYHTHLRSSSGCAKARSRPTPTVNVSEGVESLYKALAIGELLKDCPESPECINVHTGAFEPGDGFHYSP